MKHPRFFWKLFLSFIFVVFLATFFTWIFVSRSIEAKSMAEIEDVLRARSILLRELSLRYLDPESDGPAGDALQGRIEDLGAQIGTRLTVIRADGLVLADSQESPALMDAHGTRPEVLDARQRGEGRSTRFSNTLQTRMMYFALPIHADGELLGYARVSLSLAEMDARLRKLQRSVTLGGLIAAIMALLLGLWISRRISRPIQEMTSAARAMAVGRPYPRITTRGDDEITELAAAFELMADQLQIRLESISSERNKLEGILSGMVEGVIAVNSEERVLHMNDVAGRLLSVDPASSIGKPIWEVARLPAIGELLSECMERRMEISREIRQSTSGGERIMALYGSPLEGNGSPAGAVLVLHEITELRRLESMRRDFVANVSHELKTPLTAIRGLVETLEDDGEMPAETRRRFIRKIRLQTEHLAAQVSDLLTLSRLEALDADPEDERIDLREIIHELSSVMGPAAEAGGIRLETETPASAVVVRGERAGLEQAIRNLLDNAIKYTDREGLVRLRLSSEDLNARVEVEDTGIGIEALDQERIFERFYRVDKARSRDLGGTGLGLAIVKHVALQHGGGIAVDSMPGRGSLFVLTVPLSD